MGGLQSTERSLSVTASKGLSALRAAPDLCCAVNQRLTSVVREICTLRSVGAGGSAPGDPVVGVKFRCSTRQIPWQRLPGAMDFPNATFKVSLQFHLPSVQAENLFLRRQLALYIERGMKPRRMGAATRIALAWLSRWFDWRDALVVVRPETLIRWHRVGWKL